jgi:hypothetical protein
MRTAYRVQELGAALSKEETAHRQSYHNDHHQHHCHGTDSEPERQHGTQSVVKEVAEGEFDGHKEEVQLEHVPIEPAPLVAICRCCCLCAVHKVEVQNLMRCVPDPRSD